MGYARGMRITFYSLLLSLWLGLALASVAQQGSGSETGPGSNVGPGLPTGSGNTGSGVNAVPEIDPGAMAVPLLCCAGILLIASDRRRRTQ